MLSESEELDIYYDFTLLVENYYFDADYLYNCYQMFLLFFLRLRMTISIDFCRKNNDGLVPLEGEWSI